MSKDEEGGAASIRERVLMLDGRQRRLFSVLETLAVVKEFKPGTVPRARWATLLGAIAKIPMLTPEIVAKPRMAALVERLGLTPELLARGRRASRATYTPGMEVLVDLDMLAKHTTLTPELVVNALVGKKIAVADSAARRRVELARAVQKMLRVGTPGTGGTVGWKEFCNAVRRDCGKPATFRGYSDKSIQRAVVHAQDKGK